MTNDQAGYIVGWNSGTLSYVCICVVAGLSLASLERALSTLRDRIRLATRDVDDDDVGEPSTLVDALAAAAETDEAICLLERLSERLVDAFVLAGDDDDERASQRSHRERVDQLRRLADVFERTSYPTVLGTWGSVSDDDGAVAAKVQKSDLWITLKAVAGPRLARRASSASLASTSSSSSSSSSPSSSSPPTTEATTSFAQIDATALCYGYSLVQSIQVMLFEAPRGDAFFAQVSLER